MCARGVKLTSHFPGQRACLVTEVCIGLAGRGCPSGSPAQIPKGSCGSAGRELCLLAEWAA